MAPADGILVDGWPRLRGAPPELKLHWLLRVAVAAEFVGHGAFGIMGKEGWLPYYDVFGIPESAAWDLMPVVGSVDITLGILVLAYPMRALFLWTAVWGLFTAGLRPLAAEGGWEFVERSYNYGIPLVLLLLVGTATSVRQWLERIRDVPRLTPERAARFSLGLRAIIGAYLIGHGALGLFTNKPLLIRGYESIGLDSLVSSPDTLNGAIGGFEIALGFAVLMAPMPGLLLFVLIWKLATESLHLTMGAYGAGFEVLERCSAYAAPLALIAIERIAAGHRPVIATTAARPAS